MQWNAVEVFNISIHALREEGDPVCPVVSCRSILFLSTPSARRATGGDLALVYALGQFLSTPSARRATTMPTCPLSNFTNFYPRPPRGGRPFTLIERLSLESISIHALREEGDYRCGGSKGQGPADFYPRPPRGGRLSAYSMFLSTCIFLSTPSARRATLFTRHPSARQHISIHALREEGDCG